VRRAAAVNVGADWLMGEHAPRSSKAAFPEVTILILTATVTSQRLAAAAEAGAAGFLAKDGSFTDILAAIRNPMPGKMVVEGAALDELIKILPVAPASAEVEQPAGQPPRPEPARLTAREQEVLG
jgi:DNA-binding NarL/FixJ family response regulator